MTLLLDIHHALYKSVTHVLVHLLPMSPVYTLGEGWGEGKRASIRSDLLAPLILTFSPRGEGMALSKRVHIHASIFFFKLVAFYCQQLHRYPFWVYGTAGIITKNLILPFSVSFVSSVVKDILSKTLSPGQPSSSSC